MATISPGVELPPPPRVLLASERAAVTAGKKRTRKALSAGTELLPNFFGAGPDAAQRMGYQDLSRRLIGRRPAVASEGLHEGDSPGAKTRFHWASSLEPGAGEPRFHVQGRRKKESKRNGSMPVTRLHRQESRVGSSLLHGACRRHAVTESDGLKRGRGIGQGREG